MKKLLLIILATAMLTACTAKPTSDEKDAPLTETSVSSETKIDLSGYSNLNEELKAYFSYDGLSDYKDYNIDSCFDIVTDLYFIDIDGDEVYEMLRCLHFNYPVGGHTIFFYDYVDEQVVFLGETDGGANAERYAYYYREDTAPVWLLDEPVQMYKNKEDGSVKFLTYRISASGRDLGYYFTEIQIVDGNVVSENKDYCAMYCIYDDGATPMGWTYTFDGKAISEDEFVNYIGVGDEYQLYTPEKSVLHTELECNSWRNKDMKEDLTVWTEYERAVKNAVENIKSCCYDEKNRY
ncbi:MAG: membrane lipoprotein lipid attachment site-containing protein [Oscillospiraceae bacterium]